MGRMRQGGSSLWGSQPLFYHNTASRRGRRKEGSSSSSPYPARLFLRAPNSHSSFFLWISPFPVRPRLESKRIVLRCAHSYSAIAAWEPNQHVEIERQSTWRGPVVSCYPRGRHDSTGNFEAVEKIGGNNHIVRGILPCKYFIISYGSQFHVALRERVERLN